MKVGMEHFKIKVSNKENNRNRGVETDMQLNRC